MVNSLLLARKFKAWRLGREAYKVSSVAIKKFKEPEFWVTFTLIGLIKSLTIIPPCTQFWSITQYQNGPLTLRHSKISLRRTRISHCDMWVDFQNFSSFLHSFKLETKVTFVDLSKVSVFPTLTHCFTHDLQKKPNGSWLMQKCERNRASHFKVHQVIKSFKNPFGCYLKNLWECLE